MSDEWVNLYFEKPDGTKQYQFSNPFTAKKWNSLFIGYWDEDIVKERIFDWDFTGYKITNELFTSDNAIAPWVAASSSSIYGIDGSNNVVDIRSGSILSNMPYTTGAHSWSYNIVGTSYIYYYNPYMEYIYYGGYWYFICDAGQVVLATANFTTWVEMRGPVSHYDLIGGILVPTYYGFQYFYTFAGSLYAMSYDPLYGEVKIVLGLRDGVWLEMDDSGRTSAPTGNHFIGLGYNDSALYITGESSRGNQLWASYDGGINFTKLVEFAPVGSYNSFLTSIIYHRGRYWLTDSPYRTDTGSRSFKIYYSNSVSMGSWIEDATNPLYIYGEAFAVTSESNMKMAVADRAGYLLTRGNDIIEGLTLNTEKSVPLDLDTMGTGAYVAVESTMYPNIDVYYVPSTMDSSFMLFSGASKYSSYGVEASFPGDCVFFGEMLASGWVGIRFTNQELAEYYTSSGSANALSWSVYDDVDRTNLTICDENNHLNILGSDNKWLKIYDQPYEPYTESGLFAYHAQERYATIIYYGTREGSVYEMDVELSAVPTVLGHTDGNKITCIRVPLW
jgi:hypothetical protein